MTLLRAAARTLLASSFVASGIKSVRHPEALVPAAEPVTDKLVPLVKKYVPAQVASYLPEDTVTLVRVNGVAQVVGGLALATGKGRRLGALVLAASLVPSTIAKYPFWSRTDPDEKAQDRAYFLKNLSILGGVLLAAGDTEGKPSLVYRAHKGGEHLARDTRKAGKKFGKKTGLNQSSLSKNAGDLAGSASKNASNLADGALAGGAALVGAAVATSRKAKKQAVKQAKAASVVAAAQFKEAQEVAAKQAKIAKKQRDKHSKVAKKEGSKQLARAQKEGAKRLKRAQKKAGKVKKNIRLGEN